jgi:hypothetical protein
MAILPFKREVLFLEDGTIRDPVTGVIRELFPAQTKSKTHLTGPQIAAKFVADIFRATTGHDVHLCRYANSGGDLSFHDRR